MRQPAQNNIIHLTPRHLYIRPRHRAIEGGDTRKRVGLDNGGGIDGRIGGILKLDAFLHRRGDGEDPTACEVHQAEHRKRDDECRSRFFAAKIEETCPRHMPDGRGAADIMPSADLCHFNDHRLLQLHVP